MEEELQSVGENMKHLEKSSTDALEREERLKEQILQVHINTNDPPQQPFFLCFAQCCVTTKHVLVFCISS